ncbi:MAG: InlB B-repeat-containing protein, partial [Candidatus Caccovivens sp.]
MDNLKRKFGFYILASACLFATMFGMGVSSLTVMPTSFISETEDVNEEEQNVGALATSTGNISNMNNWKTYNFDSFTITYDDATDNNAVSLTTVGGWEILALPVKVATNTQYNLSFNYTVPTYTPLSGYTGLPIMVLYSTPANSNCSDRNFDSAITYLPTSASSGTASVSFNSGSYTTVYLAFNFGYVNDGQTLTFNFGNFQLTGGSTYVETYSNGLLTLTHGNLSSYAYTTSYITSAISGYSNVNAVDFVFKNSQDLYLSTDWDDYFQTLAGKGVKNIRFIFEDCGFKSKKIIDAMSINGTTNGFNLNFIFDGCYISTGTLVSNLWNQDSGEMDFTFKDCVIEYNGTLIDNVDNYIGFTINMFNNIVYCDSSANSKLFASDDLFAINMVDNVILGSVSNANFISANLVYVKNVVCTDSTTKSNIENNSTTSSNLVYVNDDVILKQVGTFASSSSSYWEGAWDFENKWLYLAPVYTTGGNKSTYECVYPINFATAQYKHNWENGIANPQNYYRVMLYKNDEEYSSELSVPQANRVYCEKTNTSATLSTSSIYFSMPGYVHTWSYSPEGAGSSSVTITQDGDLYAIWSPAIYTISLDSQSGTGTSPSIVYLKYSTGWYSDSTATTSISGITTVPSRAGYTFAGFYTATTGGTQIINANGSFVSGETTFTTSNTTIYAQWTANTYTITYKDGSTTISSLTPTSYKTTDSTTLPSYSKTGYTFVNWKASQNGTGDYNWGTSTYASGTKVTGKYGNVILTAQWKANTYTITLNQNNATTEGTKSVTATYGSSTLSSAITNPSRTGYTFAGWTTGQNSGSVVIDTAGALVASVSGYTNSSKQWVKASDTTLYAKWTANTYIVNYDVNHDSVAVNMFVMNRVGSNGSTINGVTYSWNEETSIITLNGTLTASTEIMRIPVLFKTDDKYTINVQLISGTAAGTSGTPFLTYDFYDAGGTNRVAYRDVAIKSDNSQNIYTMTIPSTLNDINGYIAVRAYITYNPVYTNANIKIKVAKESSATEVSPIGKIVSYNSTYGTLSKPTRIGYTLEGWYLDSACTNKVTSTTTVTTVGNHTLYAKWTANKYTVTFNGNVVDSTISITPTSQEVAYDSAYGTLANATRTGYTLEGWYLDSACTNKVTSTTIVKTVGDHTLYAKWTPKSYTITLNGNGATTAGTSSVSATYGSSTLSSAITNPSRTGYTFGGWTTAQNSGAVVIDTTGALVASVDGYTNAAKQWVKASDTTLYAKWTPKSYTITLNGNGATVAGTASVSATYGSSTLSSAITNPSRTGYTFGGWTTKQNDGSVVIDTTGALVASVDGYTNASKQWIRTTSDAITLYAFWGVNSYVLTINPNGGNVYNNLFQNVKDYGTIDSQINSSNISYYVSGGILYAQSIGTSATDNYGHTYINAKLTAGKTYVLTLSYQSLDSSIIPSVGAGMFYNNVYDKYYFFDPLGTANYGTISSSSKQFVVASGYDELKYYLRVDPNLPNAKVAFSNIAVYETTALTEAYSISKEYQSYYYIPTPTRTGYTFDGWTVTGAGTTVEANVVKMGSENATLTAKWKANDYTLVYETNGGNTVSNNKKTYGTTFTTTELPTLTKTGYTFNGWYNNSSFSTKLDTSKTFTTSTATFADVSTAGTTATIYAKWTANTYTLVYETNGGNAIANKSKIYDTTFTTAELSTPTKTGYTFNGWYNNSSFNTKLDTSKTFTTSTATFADVSTAGTTATIYAKWTANTYTITLNGNGATTAGTTSVNVTYDSSTISPITNPSKTGYTFAGWTTAQNSGAVVIDISGNFVASVTGYTNESKQWVKASNTTLYAKWTANSYTITYNCSADTLFDSNGNVQTTNVFEYTPDDDLTLFTNKKAGWIFDGWTVVSNEAQGIEPEGSWIDLVGTTISTMHMGTGNWGNVTLKYVSHGDIYTLYIDAGDGTVSPSELTVIYGSNLNATGTTLAGATSMPIPTLTGYNFNGYQRKNSTMSYENGKVSPTVVFNDGNFEVDHTTKTATITAIYQIKTITVVYHDSKGQQANTSATYGSSIILRDQEANSEPESFAGYYFDGWYTAETEGTLIGRAGDTYTIRTETSPIHMYAHWIAETYTLNLDDTTNGGKAPVSPHTHSVTFDGQVNKIEYLPTKDGYSFKGYFTSATGGIQIFDTNGSANANVTGYISSSKWIYDVGANGSTLTLYAQYDVASFKVTANANGGKISVLHGWIGSQWDESVTKDITYETAYGPLPEAVKNGYKHIGWATSRDATSVNVDIDTIFKTASTQNIYAVWEIVTYNITYKDGDEILSTLVPTSYTTIDTTTLPNYSKTGYTFEGWKPESKVGNWDPLIIYKGVSLTDKYGDVTLIAQWVTNNYKITLNDNATKGITTPGLNTIWLKYNTSWHADVSGAIGSEITNLSTLPVRTGYTFKGYFTATSGGTKIINVDGTFVDGKLTFTSLDTTLYAIWEPKTYTISLDSNNATVVGTSSVTATFDSATISEITNPTKIGYDFAGWTATKNGTDIVITTSGKYSTTNVEGYITDGVWTRADSATLYAKWIPQVFKVTLDKQGGTGGLDAYYYKYQQGPPYYYTDKECTTTVDGGNGSIISTPTKTGYVFGGYFTETNAGGTAYVGSEGNAINSLYYNVANDITLYAHWTVERYQLDLRGNGGSDVNAYAEYNNSNIYSAVTGGTIVVPKSTRIGYTFGGYYVEQLSVGADTTGKTRVIDENGVYIANVSGYTNSSKQWIKDVGANGSTQTLYAYWTETNFTITYIDKGVSGTDTQTTIGLQNYKISDSSISLYGYTNINRKGYLLSWKVSSMSTIAEGCTIWSNAQTSYFGAGYVLTNNGTIFGDVTLQAVWTAETTDITINLVLTTAPDAKGPSKHSATFAEKVSAISAPSDRPAGVLTVAWATGYTFDGFYTTQDGGYKIFNADGTVVTTAVENWLTDGGYWAYDPDEQNGDAKNEVTLYAHWTPNKYTLNYTIGAGVKNITINGTEYTTSGSVQIAYNSQVVLTAIAKPGYIINKWKAGESSNPTTEVGEKEGANASYTFTFNTTQTYYVVASATAKSVNYTIKYRTQNTDGSYSNNTKGTYQADTGSSISLDTAKNAVGTINGFSYATNRYYEGDTLKGTNATSFVVTVDAADNGNLIIELDYNYLIYNITYVLDGGAQSDAPIRYNIHGAVSTQSSGGLSGNGSLPINPTKTGYSFAGWKATTVDGNWTLNNIYANPQATIAADKTKALAGMYGDVTLTAQWTANVVSVTLNTNKPSNASANPTANASNVFVVYDSKAYSTSTTPSQKVYSARTGSGYPYTPSGNVVLPTASLEGWIFNGWYTETTGGTKVFSADGQLLLDWTTANIGSGAGLDGFTLYANWTARSYNLVYVSNGGSAVETVIGKAYDSAYTIAELPTPTKTGYTFKGWYAKSDLSGTALSTTSQFNKNGATFDNDIIANATQGTIFAKWEANTYTITLNGNGGAIGTLSNISGLSGTASPLTATYDVTGSFTAPVARTGFTFKGWSTSETELTTFAGLTNGTITGSNGSYSSTTTVKNLVTNGNINLYAIWEADYVVISLNLNKPGSTTPSISASTLYAKYGDKYSTAKTSTSESSATGLLIPSCNGYNFNGWYTSTTGGTKMTNDSVVSGTYNSTNNKYEITLYAQWTPKTYTVIYHKNPYTGADTTYTDTVLATFDSPYTVKTESELGFEVPGFSFGFWGTSAQGGVNYSEKLSDGKLTLNSNCYGDLDNTNNRLVLYAIRSANTYTITLNGNGATTAGTQTIYLKFNTGWYSNIECSNAISTITIPTKTGYDFAGYVDANDNTIINSAGKIVGSTTFTTEDVTINAVWIEREDTPYKVKHWTQKLGVTETAENSTNYELLSGNTEILYGKTGASVTPALKSITGFTAKSTASSLTILADGSAVKNYYYTRNTYTLTITKGKGIASVSTSGTGVNGTTIQYGATVTLTATPETGYTFASWSATGATMSSTTSNPATFTQGLVGVSVTANATAQNVAYKIEAYVQDLTTDTSISHEYMTFSLHATYTDGLKATTGTEVTINPSLYTITGFTFDEENANNVLTATIAGDGSTTFKLYFTRNKYYFDLNMMINGTNATGSQSLHKVDITTNGGNSVSQVGDYYQYIYYGATITVSNLTVASGYSYVGYNWSEATGGTPIEETVFTTKTNIMGTGFTRLNLFFTGDTNNIAYDVANG